MMFNGYKDPGKGRGFALSLLVFFLITLHIIPGCTSNPQEARSFKTLFDHYRVQENVDAISFPPGLVGLFLSDSDPDQAELKKLMQELSSFRMLSLNESSAETSSASDAFAGDTQFEEIKTSVMEFTRRNEFQDLFRMQSGGQDIFLRIKEKDGMVREAVLMMEGDEIFFIIDLRGNISLDHFTKLAEGGYLDELTGLSNLNF